MTSRQQIFRPYILNGELYVFVADSPEFFRIADWKIYPILNIGFILLSLWLFSFTPSILSLTIDRQLYLAFNFAYILIIACVFGGRIYRYLQTIKIIDVFFLFLRIRDRLPLILLTVRFLSLIFISYGILLEVAFNESFVYMNSGDDPRNTYHGQGGGGPSGGGPSGNNNNDPGATYHGKPSNSSDNDNNEPKRPLWYDPYQEIADRVLPPLKRIPGHDDPRNTYHGQDGPGPWIDTRTGPWNDPRNTSHGQGSPGPLTETRDPLNVIDYSVVNERRITSKIIRDLYLIETGKPNHYVNIFKTQSPFGEFFTEEEKNMMVLKNWFTGEDGRAAFRRLGDQFDPICNKPLEFGQTISRYAYDNGTPGDLLILTQNTYVTAGNSPHTLSRVIFTMSKAQV